MTRRLFGTDGIRGKANVEPMTAGTALKVAMAAARKFRNGGPRPQVVIGKDTRLSGYMLEPALTAGFIAMGVDVILVGPLPTPAISMLTRSMRAELGVMISASHNPYDDNGIKIFGPDGYKLSDEVEAEIEAAVLADTPPQLPDGRLLGRATRYEDARGRYIEGVKASFPKGLTLDGLRLVVDCANGAAYKVAPMVFSELGAEVIPLGVSPNGLNINDGVGATATQAMCRKVVETGAHLGIALDGDADRLILADENGEVVDGDQIMATVAKRWLSDGRLRGGAVVSTVMSNLGLERCLGELGLALHRTKVGDRHVVDHMRSHALNVGGEQSGHIVLSDFATTGDGILAALQVLSVVAEAGGPASRACRHFQPVPQLLRNVRFVAGAGDPTQRPGVADTIAAAQQDLGAAGRLVIRKSGTEPVIRVMAEGDDAAQVERVVQRISIAIELATSSDAAE